MFDNLVKAPRFGPPALIVHRFRCLPFANLAEQSALLVSGRPKANSMRRESCLNGYVPAAATETAPSWNGERPRLSVRDSVSLVKTREWRTETPVSTAQP